ncbi:MAG: lysophospholipase [Clostridiales bacterium]|nr:lysophospholipase [Clostridiales bacterium]
MAKEAWRLEKEKMVEGFREKNRLCEKGQVVFAGSSLMEMFPVEEWASELGPGAPKLYNRGVGGYRTDDMLPIVDLCVTDLQPRKVFINIGTNDLSDPDLPMETMIQRYDQILTRIEKALPGVRIYLMAYYPINYEAAADFMKPGLLIRTNEKIAVANGLVQQLAEKHGQCYIDVNAPLKDEQGRLKAEYTIEGMHIKPEGYRAIFPELVKYIME